MITHHIQKRIIADLVEIPNARYSQLKPKHIEGNVFTYHLQSLIKQKYITKNDKGLYSLTNTGKLYGINSSLKAQELLEQAHVIILLCIKQGDRWLLRKRLVEPLYGKIGFIHGEPRAEESIEEASARILEKRTGLKGVFTTKGSGYIRLYSQDSLVAFSAFTLVDVTQVEGDLITTDAHGENYWHEKPDFKVPEMIPSMADISGAMQQNELFFIDKKYRISS